MERIETRARVALKALSTSVYQREAGQTFIEYALLITFIAVVAMVAVQLLGTSISSLFSSAAGAF